MPDSNEDAEWVVRGPMTGCQCFHCVNKIDQKIEGRRVWVLCMDECNYRPKNVEKEPEEV